MDGAQNVPHGGALGARPAFHLCINRRSRPTPSEYYAAKLDAENEVTSGSVPWTILRGTQFHELIDSRMQNMTHEPIVVIDPHLKYQPVDVRDFLRRIGETGRTARTRAAPRFWWTGSPRIW